MWREFAEYTPDLPALNNPGATVATNVKPAANSYLPFMALATDTDALNGQCLGAIAVKDADGVVYNFAGDATKLYSLSSGSHSDISGSSAPYAATSDSGTWEFTKWGESVLCVNGTDDMQQIALGGNATAIPAAPIAKTITTVRDFVVVGNLTESSVRYPQRVRWSAIDNELDWTASLRTQADLNEMRSTSENGGGVVQRVIGGEYGLIFQERSTWRMTYVGPPIVFRLDEVFPNLGTLAKNSVVRHGNMVWMLGHDGFYQIMNGQQFVPIGRNKVDDTFFTELDYGALDMVIGAYSPAEQLVYWAYPGDGSSGTPNRILIFDWANQRWAGPVEQPVQWLYSALGQSTDLEGLDAISASLDDLGPSLDSRQWYGGGIELGAYSSDNKRGTFNGTALDATIETGEFELVPNRRAYVSGVRPTVLANGGATVTVQCLTRDNLKVAPTASTETAVTEDTQQADFRCDARYHRFRVKVSGGFEHATGTDVNAIPSGGR